MHRHDGFRELDRQECLRLLARVPIGRIVYTDDALPAVLPVNFTLDQDFSVLLRTSAASRLARAVDMAVVAFEADGFDRAARTGWSVVVTGRATVIADRGEHERLSTSGPRSWAPTSEGVFIRIDPELITGRVLEESGRVQEDGEAAVPADVP
jgi:nitroimidazol reductase NimA-like FMN-containing flavoprotein (pyridoxamine 5'-phosphate oxidase superfamily)